MCASRADMLRADLRTLGDDVHERHRATAPEVVVGLQPFEDRRRLGRRTESLLLGEIDELARGEPGLDLDVVEVGLEGHVSYFHGWSRSKRGDAPLLSDRDRAMLVIGLQYDGGVGADIRRQAD